MRCPAAIELAWDEGTGPPPLAELAEALEPFSPPRAWWPERPATLWIDAAGLSAEDGPAPRWLARVQAALEGLGWHSAAALGCAPYAAALIAETLPMGSRRVVPEREAARVLAPVPLSLLGLGERSEASLARLGLHRIGDLKRLPRRAMTARYGELLRSRLALLAGEPPPWTLYAPPQTVELDLELEVERIDQLLFAIKAELHGGLATLAASGLACAALGITGVEEGGRLHEFNLRPARPSLDEVSFLELLRLRLEAVRLRAPWRQLTIELHGEAASHEQLRLFGQGGRDPRRRDEGLARLRAELGDMAVQRPALQPRHHPSEASRFLPHEGPWPRLTKGSPRGQMVRRLLAEPRAVEGPPDRGPWRLLGEPVAAVGGPYPLQQGWWRRPREEDEYIVRTGGGRLLWLLHDLRASRWWLIGWVA